MSVIRTYAQRRLSPFQGTVQVIDAGDGRALSYDGWVWHIQLRAQTAIPQQVWGGIGPRQSSRPFFHYGSWTVEGEIRRLPINPVLGDVSGYPALAEVLAALNDRPTVPFPLGDRLECWILDADGQPVVLYSSACDEASRTLPRYPRWQAGNAEGPSFASTSLDDAGVASEKPHAAWLTDEVTRDVGAPLSLQWIYREDDESGRGLGGKHLRPEWVGRKFTAQVFPPLLLKEAWTDALLTSVVKEYLSWQSPYLLMLPSLDEDKRRMLEIQACKRPKQLMNVRRLLPAIQDQTLIDATLVRARLEQAG